MPNSDTSWPLFQFYYSVRVLPGQEPFNVWVGWVTPDFHLCDMAFDSDAVHTVTVTLGDDSGKVQERLVCITGMNEFIKNSNEIICLLLLSQIIYSITLQYPGTLILLYILPAVNLQFYLLNLLFTQCQAIWLLHGVCWRSNRPISESEKLRARNWLFDRHRDWAAHIYLQWSGDGHLLPSRLISKLCDWHASA